MKAVLHSAATTILAALTILVCAERTTLAQTAYQWKNVSIGGGGYVTGIFLHPLQQNLAYIRTDVGGFYRWDAVNSRWLPLTDWMTLAQSNYFGGEALALDAQNPNVVYIACGKSTAFGAIGTIFKSTDQGATWSKLNIDLKMGGNDDKHWAGERLVVNPLNSNVIFFGSRLDGLWQSSDAGATWSKVTSFNATLTSGIGITSLAFDKVLTPGTLYAAAYGDGVYQSTDTGVTWQKLAGSPAQVNRLATAPDGSLYATHQSGVSKFSGGVWSNLQPGGLSAPFCAISINPLNPNDLLTALGETQQTKIFRSTDSGATWTEKQRTHASTVPWWTDVMLTDQWIAAMEFDPSAPGRVWFTDWGGVLRTESIDAQPALFVNYEVGHEELVNFALAAPAQGALLLSGHADQDGFNHNNGLDSFPSRNFSANGGPVFQDTYSIAYCEQNQAFMYRAGGNRWNNVRNIAKSTDGGVTWSATNWAASFPGVRTLRVAVSASNPANFVAIVDNGTAQVTQDGGSTFTAVSGLPAGPAGPWYYNQPVAADKVIAGTFYYLDTAGRVYRSTDGGATFARANPTALPSAVSIAIKTPPGTANEVWAGLNFNGLFRSTNGGTTFTKIANVNRAFLFAFGAPQPGSTTPALFLYGTIGGIDGIFRSLDRGVTWTNIADPNVAIGDNPQVMEASWQQFGLVFIGTNGRGIYYGTPF
jgi:photosystem II stability/assembly factor-like uncharacterized protein